MTSLAKRLEDAARDYGRVCGGFDEDVWDSDVAPLLAEVAALEARVADLEYTANLRTGGCECSDEDMCRFARERDEALARIAELESHLRLARYAWMAHR